MNDSGERYITAGFDPQLTKELGDKAMVAAQEQVQENGYLTPEFIASKEGRWILRDGRPVWIVCGDERASDDSSVAAFKQIAPEAMPLNEAGLSIYGQTVGITLNMLIVGVAQHGEEFYDQVGGIFKFLQEITEKLQAEDSAFKALPSQHSDATKEQAAHGTTETSFCPHGSEALGCAYCMNAGAVLTLMATDELVMTTGRDNLAHVTGKENDTDVTKLQKAALYVRDRVGAEFAFTRSDYAQSELPVQILQGIPHMDPATTGYIMNLDPMSVGQAGDIYRGDVAGVALQIRRLPLDKPLDAGLLIKSQGLQAAAVRAALASGNPNDLGFGARGGSFEDALSKIAELEQTA